MDQVGGDSSAELLRWARSGSLSREQADGILIPLISEAVAGNHQSVDTLVAATFELTFVRGAIGRVLFDRQDAEDALQETLIAVMRSLRSFDLSRSYVSWVVTIAHNKAIDVLRKRRSMVTDLSQREDLFEAERFSSALATRMDVLGVLDEISPKLAEVVRLRDIDRLSYQEIADSLDIKLNTVRSRLARGRAQAQTLIELRT